jgi:hypothetical protein
MEFPSLGFIQALQAALNKNATFAEASQWSDVKVLLCFGDDHYWLKLYGGKVIDWMTYVPLANPLGWDYMIAGPMDAWNELRASGDGHKAGAALMNCGRISVDGNMLQANRMFASTHVIVDAIRDLK